MSDILDTLKVLRDLINAPRAQAALMRGRREWHMLCSCLDVIGDTELALIACAESPPSETLGVRYLRVYGALQALFVQQDAVSDLATALQIPYTRSASVSEVREIRNDAVGHPTDRRGQTSVFLIQASLTDSTFATMKTFPDDRPPRFSAYSIPELLATQRASLASVLCQFVLALREAERRHREEFRHMSLADLFPESLGYSFEKVYEGLRRPDYRELGAGHVEQILGTVAAFENALRSRGILDAYDMLRHDIAEAQWPLQELLHHLRNEPSSVANERAGRIYTFFCSEALKQLQAAAVDLDAKYQTNP